MSETTAHAHPTPRDYWMIALILAVITGVEVAITYISALDSIVVPALILLSIAKFALVVGWFMHLRFDLKRYRRLFYIGLAAAPVLFGAVLFTFGVLIGD